MADLDMTKRDNLIIHVEGLQATLTKRNKRIEELEAILAQANHVTDPRLQKAYRDGWKDCAAHIMESTAQAARALGKVRKDAFDIYLQGERIGREENDGGTVQLPADQEAVGGAGEGEGAEGPALGEGHRG